MPVKKNKKKPSRKNKKRKAEGNTNHQAKRRKKSPVEQVFVVDEHNDAMLPFIEAVQSGRLPSSGVKMLHYDSHPDLGNITKADHPSTMKKVGKGGKMTNKTKTGLHKLTDIATWITPLALAGYMDECIWVAGHWCHQIDEGSYELVCGIDKDDGLIKTASADGDNESNAAIQDYWDCDGTAGELENLTQCKTWTLHVFKHNRKGQLPDDSFWSIMDILQDSTWVLDIDEDFFSCNNPHRDDFRACFGPEVWNNMKKLYDIGSPYDQSLEKILQKKLFLKNESKFMKCQPVKKIIKALNEEYDNPENLVLRWYKFLKSSYKKEYEDGVNIEELFNLDDVHTAGLYSGLPHHITRADDIVIMGNGVEELLNEMKPNNPVHVTLATSRADRYLPDAQAAIIHGMLDSMMEAVYEDVNVVRMDKPEFSIVFAPESDDEE